MAMLLCARGPGVGFSTTVGGTSISITVISTEASGGVRRTGQQLTGLHGDGGRSLVNGVNREI